MSSTSAAVTVAAPVEADGQMTHREILEALSGLLLGMFVAILSSTVVSNALPTIIADLGGGQSRVHLGRHRDPARHHRDHARSGASSPTCSARSCWSRSPS